MSGDSRVSYYMAVLLTTFVLSISAIASEASSGAMIRAEISSRGAHLKRHHHLHAGAESEFPIDFVYCWAGEAVQGSETIPSHDNGHGTVAADHNVGQGFGELRYSIRYLEANAPWFNKVYILVDSPADRPSWLTEASTDKVVMIDRCSLFPRAQDCPTENTDACKAVMHRIPGLSEKFVALDDDFILLHPLSTSDFFSSQGQPLVLPANAEEEYPLYHQMPQGPDMPPESRPTRMGAFHHVPVPLLVSYAMKMESTYPDWYAFVRSHHTRFVCCDSSVVGNGLDEAFQLIYPHMLLKWNIGVQRAVPYHSTCLSETDAGPTQPDFVKCMTGKIRDPGPKFMALQNILDADTWAVVQKAMEDQLAEMPKSKFVAEEAHDSSWWLLRLPSVRSKHKHANVVTFER